MIITLVPASAVPKVWLSILPYVRDLIEVADGRTSELQIYEDALQRKHLLWIAIDDAMDNRIIGFATSKINSYPKRRLLSVEYLGGEDFESWMDALQETFCNFARDQGCDGIEAIGRIGWERMLKKIGWVKRLILVEFDLRDEAKVSEDKYGQRQQRTERNDLNGHAI